jgi:hypothetical protein
MLHIADQDEQPPESDTDFDFIDDSASTVNGFFAVVNELPTH